MKIQKKQNDKKNEQQQQQQEHEQDIIRVISTIESHSFIE